MDPNTCSCQQRQRPPGSPPDRLAALAAVVDDLAAQDLDGLPDAALAERVLGLRRLPDRLRRVLGHLHQVADPDGADDQAERRHGRRGLWLAPTLDGMVALQGLLAPEAGQTLLAALAPLARPANAHDTRSGGQRRADALAELARRNPGGWPAAPERRGPAPADGDRGSRQSAGSPWRGGWGGRRGRALECRGVSAAGL